MATKVFRASNVRKMLRTTAAVALIASASGVHAQQATTPTAPAPAPTPAPATTANDNVLRPLAGNIRAFGGDISGTAGNIRAFAGDSTASAGNIRAFAGNIRAFAGNIRAFQGDMVPASGPNAAFWGSLAAASGVVAPSAGNIRAFSGDLEGLAGSIRTFAENIRSSDGTLLTYEQAPAVYDGIAQQISTIVATSRATWGAAVRSQTGQLFNDAFVKPMLSRYEINLDKPKSLEGIDEVGLELFLLDWNDNLMNFSGRDQVDHWMKEINWSPSLTQQVIGGASVKIGLLDFTVMGEESKNIIRSEGISEISGMHGTAVASLIYARHNRRRVMGIAPTVDVVSYNPYDSSLTAGWSDIRTGIEQFVAEKVSVVNMSLGVPGWTLNEGWNTVFADGRLAKAAQSQLFVLAAGNDGVVQPGDIKWDVIHNPVIIVVGSVDPSGRISAFSNTPGTACLVKNMNANGKCNGADDLLMNRFMVAPGEFMLVSDGEGGVTRMSGTSFAAPLVSGTAALIADRWPWLSTRPNAVADIILESAKDLGAPGVDEVYGYGLLDVAAALSPKSFDSLSWKVSENGVINTYSAKTIRPAAVSSKSSWEAAGAYVTVFDDINKTYRDFTIPLSSKLIGQTVGTSGEQFQAYLQSRFWAWVATPPNAPSTSGFTNSQAVAPIAGFGELNAAVTLTPRAFRPGLRQRNAPFDAGLSFRVPGDKIGFSFGSGNGAVALANQSGFQLASDYDVNTGGANPFLALASGGSYASVDVALSDQLTLSSGVASQSAERDLDRTDPDTRQTLARLMPYRASASSVSLRYRATGWLSATASYTMLREKTGLLGVQSLDRTDFGQGTTTDAATYGLDIALTPTLSMAGSATLGRTRAGDASRQNIVVSRGGLTSTAFQLAVMKSKLFGQNDSVRFTVSQPLHVERGSIDFNSVEVVDRQTGELGVVKQTVALQSPARIHVAEAIYRRPVMGGAADVSLFGRARIGGDTLTARDAALTLGAAFRVGF